MIVKQGEWHKPANKNVWRKTVTIAETDWQFAAFVCEIPGDMDPAAVVVYEVTFQS